MASSKHLLHYLHFLNIFSDFSLTIRDVRCLFSQQIHFFAEFLQVFVFISNSSLTCVFSHKFYKFLSIVAMIINFISSIFELIIHQMISQQQKPCDIIKTVLYLIPAPIRHFTNNNLYPFMFLLQTE